jgi:hypothetical protein
MVYIAFILQGAGIANMLNTSTGLISEMIGYNDSASAIVYALINFVESFSSGTVVFQIMAQSLIESSYSLKILLSFVPIACSIVAY